MDETCQCILWSACRTMAWCVNALNKGSIYTWWWLSCIRAAKVIDALNCIVIEEVWLFPFCHALLMVKISCYTCFRLYNMRLSLSNGRIPYWSFPWMSTITGIKLLVSQWYLGSLCFWSHPLVETIEYIYCNSCDGFDLFVCFLVTQRLTTRMGHI